MPNVYCLRLVILMTPENDSETEEDIHSQHPSMVYLPI